MPNFAECAATISEPELEEHFVNTNSADIVTAETLPEPPAQLSKDYIIYKSGLGQPHTDFAFVIDTCSFILEVYT